VNPWSELTFFVSGRHVFFEDPETHELVSGRHAPQEAFRIEMRRVAADVAKDAEKLGRRKPEQVGKITRRRLVVHNAPVVAGTRVRTAAIWAFHAAGYSADAIIREYPSLQPEDVEAAIGFERGKRENPKKQAG
ncbi:MAG: DUF433 domain-containing protein, partial [Candidatus Dormibacteraceae bacterium]